MSEKFTPEDIAKGVVMHILVILAVVGCGTLLT